MIKEQRLVCFFQLLSDFATAIVAKPEVNDVLCGSLIAFAHLDIELFKLIGMLTEMNSFSKTLVDAVLSAIIEVVEAITPKHITTEMD